MSLALAVACSLAFSLTNGFHDAANAIAASSASTGWACRRSSRSPTRRRSPPAASSTAGSPASDALKDVDERVWYSVLKES